MLIRCIKKQRFYNIKKKNPKTELFFQFFIGSFFISIYAFVKLESWRQVIYIYYFKL